MKKFAIALALVASTAGASFAGGPALVPGEGPVAVNPPAAGSVGSGPIIGGLVGLLLIGALVGGSSNGTSGTGN